MIDIQILINSNWNFKKNCFKFVKATKWIAKKKIAEKSNSIVWSLTEKLYPKIVYRQTSNELENSKGKSEREWKVMDKISLNLVEADRHFGKTTKPGNNPDRVSTRERREEERGRC